MKFIRKLYTKVLLFLLNPFVCNRHFGEDLDTTKQEDKWDSMLLEDNRVYKCVPGSGPQHYVGQVLKYRDGRKSIICMKVSDDNSLWRELPVTA